MGITIKSGDLLKSNCTYICHQVNCRGVMGSGIARQIRETWPQVYRNYAAKCKAVAKCNMPSSSMLGDIQVVALFDDFYKTEEHKYVINLFAQNMYGNQGRFTSYDAFWECLWNLRTDIAPGSTIGFPYCIGCGLGGANWNIIYAMIEEVLGEKYNVEIYKKEE